MPAVATPRANPAGRTQRRKRRARSVDRDDFAPAKTPAVPSGDGSEARVEGTGAELCRAAAAAAAPADGGAAASAGQRGREDAQEEEPQSALGGSVEEEGRVRGLGGLQEREGVDDEAEENPPRESGSETNSESDDDCDVQGAGSISDASCSSSSCSSDGESDGESDSESDGESELDRLYANAAAKLAASTSSSSSSTAAPLRGRRKLKTSKFSRPPAVTDTDRLYLTTDKKTGAAKLDLSYVAETVVEKRPRPGVVAKEKAEKQVKSTGRGPKKTEGKGGKKQPATAGPGWFNMPATTLTPELKLDLQVLRLRGVLDRSRHYKKDDMTAGPPKYFQTGTIIAGPTDYYTSRLTRRERKRTMIDELVADAESSQYYKRKFLEIQEKKQSGGKKRSKLSGRTRMKHKR